MDKVQIKKNAYGEYEVLDREQYVETSQALPSGRVLEGSRDQGYDQEYVGYGTIQGIPVIAIYLLSTEDYDDDNEDTGGWDWDNALRNGRIVIDVDELPNDVYALLVAKGKIC